ncbi:MAG: hypothetical protein ACREQY_15275, partial [Candidatus Binatia bacterium]
MAAVILTGTVSMSAAANAEGISSSPRAHRSELPNGLRLLVIEQPHLPMVVVNALVDAGVQFE